MASEGGGNGATDFTSSEAGIFFDTADNYEADAMIRFNGLSLPSGAQVTSATVTLTFEDYYGGNAVYGYYLKNAWSPPPANLGWLNRDSTNQWNTPGAKGAATDIVSGAAFSDLSWVGTGNVTKTYTLDPAVVQGWIDTPSTNQGLILVNQTSDKLLRVFTSDDTTVSNHPQLTINYSTGSPPGCTNVATGTWSNEGFAAQSGTFTATFDVTPSAAAIDGVAGFSSDPQTSFTGIAAIARFNTSGFIDVRNGSNYAADVSLAYAAGTSYHFRFVINTATHTYSVYVTPSGGSESALAANYAFRTEDNTVSSLNNIVAHVDSASGSLSLCNIQTSTTDATPPAVTMTAPSGGATVSGSTVTVSATASDNVGVAGVQFLVDGQPLNAEVLAAPYQTMWNTTLVPNGTHILSARARDGAGNLTTSTAVTVTVSNASNCQSATLTQWAGAGFGAQSGSFTATYDATPSASPIDAAVGMSAGAVTSYSGLATITRFNTSGFIDARNGADYGADLQIAYSANTAYHFRVVANVATRTYSVYVTPAGGSEQTLATNYAFRSDQTGTPLNFWDITTDSTGETITLCNFDVVGGSGDTIPPSVTMTSPTNGNTYSGTIQLTATATDNIGVSSVQFFRDGSTAVGSALTASPYTLSFNTTAIANGQHTFTATAYDAAGNPGTATPVSITVNNATNVGQHPRIWLDSTTLARLQGIAQSTNSAIRAPWDALRAKCNSYLAGTIHEPPQTGHCEDYCDNPDICCGYQGGYGGPVNDYYEAVLDLGLCYRVGKGIDSAADAWANKAAGVLLAMTHYTVYNSDNGYPIRNFPPALAIGFDWIYDSSAMTPDLKTALVTSMNTWLSNYAAQDPGTNFNDHPMSNYYTGYYASQAYVAIATDGDNTSASSIWSTFLGQQQTALGPHLGVADFYTKYADGGGWPQGWEYGGLSTRNMVEPSIAALTGKAIDLIDDPSHPFHYALNAAMYIMQFSWPSGSYMDDRGTIRDFNAGSENFKCPGNSKIPVQAIETLSSVLARWPALPALGPSFAQQFHAWARTVRGLYSNPYLKTRVPWSDMLFWDDQANEADYTTLPKSYRATNAVAMRSAWNNSATWASLVAIPSLDWDQIEQVPDAGGLAITRGDGAGGDVPFLVNAAFVDRCYYNVDGEMDETDFTNNFTAGNHDIFNVFMNGTIGELDSQWADGVDSSSGRIPNVGIDQMEDKTGYVLTRANNLDSMFNSTSDINSWSRDVVYVRPNVFVVYDRTNVSSVVDPQLRWHFAPSPSFVSNTGGAVRYNVSDGSSFKGAMTTLLPANASFTSNNLWGKNKVYQLQERSPNPATDMRWLTVFDASSSSGSVSTASTISTSQVNGALLTSGPHNTVVLFGTFGNPVQGQSIASPMSYTEPAQSTTVIITDLVPSATYAVSVSTAGGNHTVTLTRGTGTFTATTSETGTLYVNISAAGTPSNP